MSGQIDWEEKYSDLLRLYALEKSEWLAEKKAEKRKHVIDDENEYRDAIAPRTCDLPVVMTMMTTRERERKAAIAQARMRIMLLEADIYPTERRNVASHLCHNGRCIDASHLIWESKDLNWRRERLCRPREQCICGLTPQCNFSLH